MQIEMASVEISSTFTCAFLVLLACVIKILNLVWFKPKKLEKMLREQGLNGNRYRLVIGDLRDVSTVSGQERTRSIQLSDDIPSHIHPYFHKTLSKFGKNSFVWFGPRPVLCITDPELVKEILLTKRGSFRKARPDPIGETIVGGLLYLEDEKWAKHRRIVNPSFHMGKLKNMVPTISLSCANMIDKWDALVSCNDSKSLEFDVFPDLESLSGDVISRTAFNSSYEAGKRVFDLQKEQVKLVLELVPFILILGWRYVPTKVNRRLKTLNHEIQSILRSIIIQRKEAMESGEKIEGDLLNSLMECNMSEAKGMTVEEVIEECKLFYFAGSETTSNLICWTMVLLSMNQEWQNRARDEITQVFFENQPTTLDGLNRLRILNMILLESLRMYPPLPTPPLRYATEAVKLGTLTLPKGTCLMLLTGLLHYDPKIWGENVNEFKPERFSNGVSGAVENPFSYIPFGGGPRICIGQNLAMMEAKVAMVMILQRFSFELGSSYVHAPSPILTLGPQRGAALLLRKL